MQSFTGKVISAKTKNTAVVLVDYLYRYPKYKKVVTRQTRIVAHVDEGEVKEGMGVVIVKSRPYSKTKHFRVSKIINNS